MLPSLFISHGSPMLALRPAASGTALARLAASLQRPTAILVVSAHWETADLRVTSSSAPGTWHDFHGFPEALYQVQYRAPGLPQLAERIIQLLAQVNLPARADGQRPLDHGAWVPLSLMYPQADIPVVQLSLPSAAGPMLQTRIGQALRQLRDEGVLLIGSGSITHNLRELDWQAGPSKTAPAWAQGFRDWMVDRLQSNDETALHAYRQQAPHAMRNHPTDEHLLPLFFARGAGDRVQIEHQGFSEGTLGMDIYSFH